MITIYESERLVDLIRKKNNYKSFSRNSNDFTYDSDSNMIVPSATHYQYTGRQIPINILPRLIEKYKTNKAFEVHLQMYITQNLGLRINKSLDESLNIFNKKIEWLGNEVSCGVGLQRIDVMFSIEESNNKRFVYPIELKAVGAYEDNTRQLTRYIDWIEQYYIPNRISIIQPVLICKRELPLLDELKENFKLFNKRKGILPLKYIEYEIINNDLVFSEVEY